MPAGAGPEESSSGPERWSGTVANQGWRRHHAGMTDDKKPAAADVAKPEPAKPVPPEKPKKVEEIGGPPGPRPARHGAWEFNRPGSLFLTPTALSCRRRPPPPPSERF